MASNFDFLKEIDNELFEIIEEAQNLFRSEYFNQCVIQTRIYAEKMAKKIAPNTNSAETFDNILNNLKDKIQSVQEKEFIEDLFFIKKLGNQCAHGEETKPSDALEVLKRAFEAGISYSNFKIKNKKMLEKINSRLFDETLLITAKPKENTLAEKYLERAKSSFYDLENKDNEEKINETKERRKKAPDPKKTEIKEKIKKAKKNLKENINKTKKAEKNKKSTPKKEAPKNKKQQKTREETADIGGFIKAALFLAFVLISLYLLTKLIF